MLRFTWNASAPASRLLFGLVLTMGCSLLARQQPELPQDSITIPNAVHAFGLPGARAKAKGTLEAKGGVLRFVATSGSSAVPFTSISAVGAGNERVELWGAKGRVMRMLMPNGGGLAAGAFMHRRVDMLTIEFRDVHGGLHSAVVFVPADMIARLADMLASAREPEPAASVNACTSGPVRPGTVRIMAPTNTAGNVPAAYRALMYEHAIERLRDAKGIGYVYRDGESDGRNECEQYTIRLEFTGFRAGSQVKRASMGPAGMFVGTTKMAVNWSVRDASGKFELTEEIKASVRGDAESLKVTDSLAKRLTKRFTAVLKRRSVRSA